MRYFVPTKNITQHDVFDNEKYSKYPWIMYKILTKYEYEDPHDSDWVRVMSGKGYSFLVRKEDGVILEDKKDLTND